MASIDLLRTKVLSFANTSEETDLEITSFKAGKELIAIHDAKANKTCLKFSPMDQDVFCTFKSEVFSALPNTLGLQGWTYVNLEKVSHDMLFAVLTMVHHDASQIKGGE